MESFLNTLLVSYFEVLKKFSIFTGRSGRREFWMFALCNFIVCGILGIFANIPIIGIIIKIVMGIYSLAILVPSIAVGIRRLHDTNRSGFFLLLALVPVVGTIVVLVFCAAEGTDGENQYGQDPKLTA